MSFRTKQGMLAAVSAIGLLCAGSFLPMATVFAQEKVADATTPETEDCPTCRQAEEAQKKAREMIGVGQSLAPSALCEALAKADTSDAAKDKLEQLAALLSAQKTAEIEEFEKSLQSLPEEEQEKRMKERLDAEIKKGLADVECLRVKGKITEDTAKGMRDVLIAQQNAQSTGADEGGEQNIVDAINRTLDRKFKNNDPKGVYPLRKDNEFSFLNEGAQLRDEVLETMRSAKSFLNLSYFEFYPDRMGSIMTTVMIAKKLGLSQTCDIAFVAKTLGTPIPKNAEPCADKPLDFGVQTEKYSHPSKKRLLDGVEELKQWKVRKELEKRGAPAAEIATEDQLKSYLKANGLSMDEVFEKSLSPIPIKFWIDGWKQISLPLQRSGLMEAMKSFGIDARINTGIAFLWGNNHTKIAANEKHAVISGGNIVDKVMDWNPAHRTWRDAALAMNGGLVNDVNHFFLSRFEGIKDGDLVETICKGKPACDETKRYFPDANVAQPGKTSSGRIVWSNSFDVKTTPTMEALSTVVKNAKSSVYLENAFFDEPSVAFLLRSKASKWGLADMKKRNGESNKVATCGKAFFDKVKTRTDSTGKPGTGKSIVLVLPKNMDQPMVKAGEAGLLNFLLSSGVDVCKWSGKVNNRVYAETSDTKFDDKTMMHSKVYMADDQIAYVGSANLNSRSTKGDTEIGVLFSDPKVVGQIKTEMFENDIKAAVSTKYRTSNFLFLPVNLILTKILHLI